MEQVDNFIVLFYGIVGVYCVYAAIMGTGYAYKNEYPEEMKEGANKLMRKLLTVIGPMLVVLAVLDYFDIGGDVLVYSGLGVVTLCIVVYVVIFRKRYAKILKKAKNTKHP